MDKLQMAHDFAMNQLSRENSNINNIESLVKFSFAYADEMQAEADKRKEKGVPKAIKGKKSIREIDDKTRDWVDEGFDVDWSKAPDWDVAWARDKNGECYWYGGSDSPFASGHIFESSHDGHTSEAPNFGYKGDWKESLRERP